MKGFLIVLLLLVACIAGLGFYRGWFTLASDSVEEKSNITFSVDKEKIQKDEKTVMSNVKDFGHQVKEKTSVANEKTTVANEKSTDGIVVRVGTDELTMTTKAGKEESVVLAADVKTTCDGQVCKAEDLKAGMRIRVTAKNDATHSATRIEALDKNAAFAKAG